MALDLIAPSAPTQTYARINAAIAALNTLLGQIENKADAATVTKRFEVNELTIVGPNGILHSLNQISTAIATLANDRSAARVDITGLQANVAEIYRRITALADRLPRLLDVEAQNRPGEAPAAFTTAIASGKPSTLPIITRAPLIREDGFVYPMVGDDLLAMTRKVRFEPGRKYLVRAVLRRETDPVDPAGDAVRVGLAWFERGFNVLSGAGAVSTVRDLGLAPDTFRVADGRTEVMGYVSTVPGSDIAAVPPAGALYGSAYVQTWGASHRTNVEALYIVDVTDGVRFAPEVSSFLARVGALESENAGPRLGVVEGLLGTPGAVTYETFADASAAGPIPASADSLVTLGFARPDDHGGAAYVYSAAPQASDRTITRGGRAFVLTTDRPNIAMFGAQPDKAPAENKACIDAALAWAKAKGIPEMGVPPVVFRSDAISNVFGINWVGSGLVLTGQGEKQQIVNAGPDSREPWVEGLEYLHCLHAQLSGQNKVIISLYGDSTVFGSAITFDMYKPDRIIDRIARQKGVWDLLCVNRGYPGSFIGNLRPQPSDPNNDAVGRTRLLEDIANPSVNCLVIKYMINDPTRGDLDYFAYNVEGVLQEIRASRKHNTLSIVLVTATSTNDTATGRNDVWYQKAIRVLRKAARRFQCCFVDVYSPYRDSVTAYERMDTVENGSHIHPLEIMNGWVWGRVADVLFDDFAMRKMGYTQTVEYGSASPNPKLRDDSPLSYDYGVSRHRALAITAWPMDGLVTTVRSSDSIIYQTLVSYDKGQQNGHVMMRVGDTTTGTWKRWGRETQPLLFQNGWGAFDPVAWGNPNCSISNDGYVQVHGQVSGGKIDAGTTIAVLPEGWRPAQAVDFACIVSSATSTGALYVLPTGEIKILYGGDKARMSLNSIRFRAV